MFPREDRTRRHKGAKKRLAHRVQQILDAGVPEQTIHTALAALLSPKPIGVESFIEREIKSGPFSSNVIEDMGSDWPALEEIDPEFPPWNVIGISCLSSSLIRRLLFHVYHSRLWIVDAFHLRDVRSSLAHSLFLSKPS
jgi:hypothetical protein